MFKLEDRSVIKISGKDSVSFLQGLLTNDVSKLSEEHFLYALLLTPQGRIISDLFLKKSEQHILADIPKSQKTSILAKFKLYKLKSDVSFEDLDSSIGVFVSKQEDLEMHLDPRSSKLGYRGFKPLNHEIMLSNFDYHTSRIKLSIPDFDMDMEIAKSLPIDFDMNDLNALSFTKGCYVGQEVVAVTHNRGTKRKKIYSAICSQGKFPEKGAEIFIQNIKIGEMLGSKDDLGLLLLNIEEVAKSENLIKNELFTLRIINA